MSEVISQNLIDVSSHPWYPRLYGRHELGAMTAQAVLNYWAESGLLDLGNVRRSLDFGAGMAGPTTAPVQLARQNGGIAEAIDEIELNFLGSRPTSIVGPEHWHTGDGIEFLGSAASTGRYDLITAFMLGPDVEGELASNLFDVSRNALREDGRLVLTSDPWTMFAAKLVCEEQRISHQFMLGLGPEARDTVIARFPDR
jgi:hypothetical protein